ncbi:MAG: hypothetical protein IJ292_03350 [Clostridia bacterium]|nr:hypothetical protein [Clostridia bacterium]
MAKKITVLLLVLILCLSSLTSCFIVTNNEKTDNDNETESDETPKKQEEFPPKVDVFGASKKRAEDILEKDFSGIDMNGERFRVVVVEDVDINIQAEQETSRLKAQSMHTELVSKKLNCQLQVDTVEYEIFLSDALAAHNAGLFYADLVCVPQKAIGYMRSRGMLSNLNQLYGDAFNEDYFSADSKMQSAGNNAYYCVAGKASVTPSGYACAYFNKNISDCCGITEKIYSCIGDGSWTLDKMVEFKVECSASHGNIIPVVTSDKYTLVNGIFSASGMKYFTTAMDSRPVLADNGDRFTNLVTKMQKMLSDQSIVYAEDSIDLFEKEKALFYIGTLEDAPAIKGAYGIMPLPKLETTQDRYYTYSNENAKVYAVLTTNKQPEHVPNVLRALNATGELLQVGWARDFLDCVLRDAESYNTVRLLFDNVTYDFAYMYGGSYASVADSSYKALTDTVFSSADYSNSIKKASAKLTKDIKALYP